MAKADLFREAQKAELVPSEAKADDYTERELRILLGRNVPVWKGSVSSSSPIEAPDGHVNLSQADLDARQAAPKGS